MRAASGFTLVELLLVMLIMGITSAMAVPRFANFMAQSRLDSAARRIVTDLRAASNHAKHRSKTKTVTFDIAGNSYDISGLNSLTHKNQNYIVQLDEEPYTVTIVSVNFGGNATLTYDGYGRPDSGGTIVISVGAAQRTLTLSNAGARDVSILAE